MSSPSEVTELHTRLLKVTLEVDTAREYWRRPEAWPDHGDTRLEQAFTGYWFGARSMARIRDLFTNLDARFADYPAGLEALAAWSGASGASGASGTGPDHETRVLICHWHLQLSDPLYRSFTGEHCFEQREAGRALTRDSVLRWVRGQDPQARWSPRTLAQFASKLLSSARGAGLLTRNQDPRPLMVPRVSPAALGYLLQLLRGVGFAGSLHENPYLRSVGLVGAGLEDRVRAVPGVALARLADLVEFQFEHDSPLAWVRATQDCEPP